MRVNRPKLGFCVVLLLLATTARAQVPPPTSEPPTTPITIIEEGPKFTAQLDYLLWFWKNGRVNQPLVNTTSARLLDGEPFQPQLLYGNQELGNNGPRSGLRLRVAGEMADGWWAEASGLMLERDVSVFNADPASTLANSPVITRPFRNADTGSESQNVIHLGPIQSGSISVRSFSKIWGAEANIAAQSCYVPIDAVFVGYRFLGLRDGLTITDRVTTEVGALGFFNALPVNENDTREKRDDFAARNDFHGIQIGGRSSVRQGAFDATVRGALAVGFTNQVLTVNGSTTLLQPEALRTELPGGLLALPSNMGRRSTNVFAVVPEIELSVGCQVFDHVRVSVGYNFLYLSSALRAGEQVDRTVNVTQLPISQLYSPTTPATNPRPLFNQTDFWAHGLNFEMLFSF